MHPDATYRLAPQLTATCSSAAERSACCICSDREYDDEIRLFLTPKAAGEEMLTLSDP